VVHETGIHGGSDPRLIGALAVVAFAFGSTVLVAEAFDGEGAGHGGGHAEATAPAGLSLDLRTREVARGRRAELAFRVLGGDGRPVRDFQVEHERRMHLIVVRRDLTGFQHLHPRIDASGTWRTPIEVGRGGAYRVFADFKRDGQARVLSGNLRVDGPATARSLPGPSSLARTAGGYRVRLVAGASRPGRASTLRFEVERGGRAVHVEPYLGAGGHLVALREGDLAYLHTHPGAAGAGAHGEHAGEATPGRGDHDDAVAFETEFPTAARYRLFFQFKHRGRVRTAQFTRAVAA
jgi:hypothetical protein